MSMRARRREFTRLARQIDGGTPLTDDQLAWLSTVFARIGRGETADDVLALKRTRGNSEKDERAREVLDFVLFYVAGQIEQGASEDDAFDAGARLQRQLHSLDPDDPDDRYSVDNLRRAARRYPEKLRPMRKTGDEDSVL
jgi:hypothetical protein